jgi:pimeloyl-ACP methyl ester carboxylesterase
VQKIFINKEVQISYTDIGIGNIVVLLHGFGEDERIWQQQTQYLAQYFRVIVPNIPGSGSSTLLKEQVASIEDYAICIHQLLENILLDSDTKITLLGHSMGGYIALAFAKLFPQKLNGFGLIHSTAFADSEEKKQVRLRGIEAIKQYGAYSFLKTTIPNLFATGFKQKFPQLVDELIEQSMQFTEAALEQYYFVMMNRTDTTDVLKQAQVPVLFVMGTEDIAAPIKDVLQQCCLPQQSHINILENVGHMGMMEATEVVNKSIKEFVDLVN